MATATQARESYCLIDSRIGRCGLAWSERGLTRMQLPESDPDATEQRMRRLTVSDTPADTPLEIRQLIANLQRYLGGERVDFSDIAIDWRDLGEMARRICTIARGIGWGHTVSYGELARRVGPPATPRTIGQAMGHNPVPIIVPCHRVLAKGHRIGGFSAPGGTFTKDRLLALEAGRRGLDEPPLPGILSS
jgi:methylated-DNA-[protein]-cysteine S-methyltransferase